jgi:hypothetical protein
LHTLDDNFLFGFCKNRTLNHKFPTECGRWQNINLFIYMYSKSRFLCVFWRIVKARKVWQCVAQCILYCYVIYCHLCRQYMYSLRNRPEMLPKDSHRNVIVSVLASSAVDSGFESRSVQTKISNWYVLLIMQSTKN